MRPVVRRSLPILAIASLGLVFAAAVAGSSEPPPGPGYGPITPIELSNGRGRYEIFWTPTRDLLLFDNDRGQVWKRQGGAWALMPKIGGVEESAGPHGRSHGGGVDRAVRALRMAQAQLTKAFGPSDPSVVALQDAISGLATQAGDEGPDLVATPGK